MKALLIIDMQQGSFNESTPRHDTEGTVERINLLAEAFRIRDFPIIFVQHDGSAENMFHPGSQDWQLLKSLHSESNDIYSSKTANDSFYNTSLQETLQSKNIKNITVTGCATDFCVESTIQSALTRDYNIVVVSDGHTTGNRPHLTAKQVIDHYNWVWQNMTPTKGSIKVDSCTSILNTL